MILASGHIVAKIGAVGLIHADTATSVVMVNSNLLYALVNKHKRSTEKGRTIVEQSCIDDHIGYLRWAGINIRPGKNNCVFDFFHSAIAPTLEFYDIDFSFVIAVSIECCSCEKVNTVERQTWDCLLVSQATVQDNLENVMAELFGPTLQRKICPECFNDGPHRTSLSLMNCPKNLFVRFHPTTTTGHINHKLSCHVDFTKILSKKIISTRSYSRYTLQSFITHNGTDDNGHYVTFARKKSDWYRLDDMNISLMKPSSLFNDPAERPPVVLAHFTRPSNIDIFSTALWNVFTNFARCNLVFPSNVSLNDAASYFAKHKIIENNPLNFMAVKRFDCPICKRGIT
jgi:hypothetical protein